METERKRKAEDQEEPHQEETPSKRPLLESDFELKNEDQIKQEEQPAQQQDTEEPFYDAITEAKEETQDNQTHENNVEENQNEATAPENQDQVVETEPKTEPSADVKAEPTPAAAAAAAAAAAVPLETLVPFDRLILVHLEATCDENPTNPAAVQVTKENSEIIELSFVVVDARNLQVLHKQQIFIKPERTPLTAFCSEVTGIKSSMLETAGSLNDAVATLDSYIQQHIEPKSFCFVTHGGWPLRIQLPREARDKNITLPSYLSFCRMFDLKQELQRWQVHHPEVSLRSTSIRDLCELFDLTRVTDQTVGLNNTLTTLEVLRYLAGFRHADVFVHPIDTNADLKQFKKEESQVIHLAGLPFEVTQGELEAWFSSNGLRPTTMWMIQPTDNSKPSISGFVVFQQHDDAMRALALNGRCLGDRPIEVCPSSARVIAAAGNMLVPFPLQAKSRQLRPGDWNCFNCSFHNFASRLHCFKCNAENPTPGPQAGQGPPAQPFSQGDWMCPSCNFHNYSSRMHCKKCAGPKPSRPAMKGPPNKKPMNGTPMQQAPPSHPQPHPSMHSGGASVGPPPPSAGYYGGYNSGARPHHHISFRPGDWYCPNQTCGFQNFASRNTCFRCHTPNPNQQVSNQQQVPNQSQQSQQQQHGQYSPHQPSYGYSPEPSSNQSGYNMGYTQGNGGVNGGGGGYGYNHASGGYSGQSSGGYAPPGGGYSGGSSSGGYSYGGGHPPSGSGYAYGGMHQGGPPGGSGPHNLQFRAGDWICPSCNSHNFASRFQCLKCTTAKPYNASGAPPAGYTASTPPMKPGDWMCRNENCSFHNFAKRTQCAKCGMANPNIQQQEGTGIGGGYGGV